MAANFKDALKQRRTYYALSNKSLISDQEIEEIISHVLLYTPSPFNSQSTRIVLLLGENHKKLCYFCLAKNYENRSRNSIIFKRL